MAQRYIEFTDADRVKHRHELAATGLVSTRQPDGTAEAGIGYEDGALTGVFTRRPDGRIARSIKL